MFTVVIAEQSYLDDLKRFSPYLEPYMKNKDVTYCCWNPDGQTLDEAVPGLDRTVSIAKDWRAVIICGTPDQGEMNRRRNPFCPCVYTPQEREKGEELNDFYSRVFLAKSQVYRQAATQPLTKLATWLNSDPTISDSLPADEETERTAEMQRDIDEMGKVSHWQEAMQLDEYYAEASVKAEVRKAIRNGTVLRSAYPKEIVCIAPRTFNDKVDEISTAWYVDISRTYSEFCDWNLYYDKMRFLAFDIMPRVKNNYDLDVLRFLNTVACFAANPTPTEAIKPGILYRFVSEANEEALRQSICEYDARMHVTADLLQEKIQKIKSKERGHLTDRQAELIFCVNEPIPVTIPAEASKDGMHVPKNTLGLSENCPQEEMSWWESAYFASKKAILKYLKQPRRGVRYAAQTMHGREEPDLSAADALNEFQFEDVIEYTHDEELKMINTGTCDLYDVERYKEMLAESDKEVRTEIKKRMKKTTTAVICIAVLVCCLICFLPMLFSNTATAKTVITTLILMGASLFLTAIIMWIVLLCLRKILRNRVGDYNDTVGAIESELDDSCAGYSKYLSHACNVLRGNAVIRFRTEAGDPDQNEILVLKKHIIDIDESREALAGIFHHYLNERVHTDITEDDAYPYDFSRPEDYEYLISFSDEQAGRIEFFDDGTYVDVPLNFLRRISAEREELYD